MEGALVALATDCRPREFFMIEPTLLDYLPLWALFLTTFAIILAAAEGGYRLGRSRGRKADAEKEAPVGSMVGATLGLLAFMLAFTFGLAASRFESRREVLQEEVNAIGTTYLRTSFLPDDQGPKVRALLREYVDLRLESLQPNAHDPLPISVPVSVRASVLV